MSRPPTPRQLDALAAWWQTGGSNTRAASILGIQPQVVRNTLLALRRQSGATSNLLLALEYRDVIERRKLLR